VSWQGAAWVAVGGALGSLLRWIVLVAAADRLGLTFPWGTFAVNVAGSFAIGMVAQWAAGGHYGIGPTARLFLATGILGGFTTFSTFSLDGLNLIREGALAAAGLYLGGSLVLGLAACWAGVAVARLLAPAG
jgi:CrcB protein